MIINYQFTIFCKSLFLRVCCCCYNYYLLCVYASAATPTRGLLNMAILFNLFFMYHIYTYVCTYTTSRTSLASSDSQLPTASSTYDQKQNTTVHIRCIHIQYKMHYSQQIQRILPHFHNTLILFAFEHIKMNKTSIVHGRQWQKTDTLN